MAHPGKLDPAQDGIRSDRSTAPEAPASSPDSSASGALSRRSLRTARQATSAAAVPVRPAARSTPAAAKPVAKKKGGWAVNVAVMTVATGIIATMSLPAFAFNPDGVEGSAFGPSVADNMKKAQSQSVEVDEAVASTAVGRDVVSATSEQQLASQRAAREAEAAAEAARQRAAVSLVTYASYSGPSVQDFLASPPYPSFSLDQVYSVAQQYIGTPYVYGGSSPAGFDCSGLVMYVYAQFGISLPHSVSGQAAAGTRISIADARPGDLVIMPGHNGFYAGNGNILDAPTQGKSVTVRPIWTSDYYIVRLGI